MGSFAFSIASKPVQYLMQKLPLLQPSMKRSTAVIASASVAVLLVATAVYLKRKRQKSFPPKDPAITRQKCTTKRKRLRKHKYVPSSTANSSPSGIKAFTNTHSRSNSNAPSVASSIASSSKSRRRKRVLLPNSPHIVEVEKLYQEGVDSFEAALEKWEKATGILNLSDSTPPVPPQESSVDTVIQFERTPTPFNEKMLLKNQRIRHFSLNEPYSSPLASNQDGADSFRRGRSRTKLSSRLHSQSESQLDELADGLSVDHHERAIFSEDQLHSIVQRAQHIQEALTHIFVDKTDTESDTDITLTGFDDHVHLSDVDSESNESYVSAKETWETRSIDGKPRRQWMFEEALLEVERGEVASRKSRADLLNCSSEENYLAKLHCLRKGFDVMLQDIGVRQWLCETARSMIECILCVAERSADDFHLAFTTLIDFVHDNANWDDMQKELKQRRVVQVNFYDVVLDFLLMDAFDDLESPPSPVVSIMKNRFLANSLKESAISAAIWSVLKAKRRLLLYPNGFLSRMYDVSTHVTPVLAWGFMGPDGKLKDVCEYFKKVMIEFLQELFSFQHVRYTTPVQMADDILRLTRDRFGSLTQYLQNSTS